MTLSFDPHIMDAVDESELFLLLHSMNCGGDFIPTRQVLSSCTGWSLEKTRYVSNSLIQKNIFVPIDDRKTPDEIRNILILKNMSGLGIGSQKCSWCMVSTYILESHHYPISKAEGGVKTVSICSNCHSEYHAMNDYHSYKINPDFIKTFFA